MTWPPAAGAGAARVRPRNGREGLLMKQGFRGNFSVQVWEFHHGVFADVETKSPLSIYLFKIFIYLFLEREEKGGRRRGRETSIWDRNINCTLTRDWARNSGMCPDWESNMRPFALRDGTLPTEPLWLRPESLLNKKNKRFIIFIYVLAK